MEPIKSLCLQGTPHPSTPLTFILHSSLPNRPTKLDALWASNSGAQGDNSENNLLRFGMKNQNRRERCAAIFDHEKTLFLRDYYRLIGKCFNLENIVKIVFLNSFKLFLACFLHSAQAGG